MEETLEQKSCLRPKRGCLRHFKACDSFQKPLTNKMGSQNDVNTPIKTFDGLPETQTMLPLSWKILNSKIILIRKKMQNRRRRQRDKIPPLTATKKFHQLIVKSPLKVRGDTDQSEDVQLTKEGETMTFYL